MTTKDAHRSGNHHAEGKGSPRLQPREDVTRSLVMDREGFLEKARQVAERLKEIDDIAIVHHHDADGICSAAIMAGALKRLGKKVAAKAVKQLYRETVEEIKGLGKNFVFVDFGSGQLDFLKEAFGEGFVVIDHHQPVKVEHDMHFNPLPYGISGSREVSGSGLCYLVAREMDEANKEFAGLAVVGAVGDMQDMDGKLSGVNAEIVAEGVENGFLKMENDLRLYGRISRPLVQFLMFSSNPILPELTANEENCWKFLNENGIRTRQGERLRSYDDLSLDEKKKLTTALVLLLNSHNVPEWKIRELVGEVYTLVKEDRKSPLRDVKEFATLCNACGRHGKSEVALEVCMGDRLEGYEKALALMAEHRRELRQGIELMQGRGVEEFEEFYFFDAGNEIKDSIVGIIAGMLYGSGAIESSKPIVAMARHEDGTVKVSARATRELIRRGLNLGKIMREICWELGGECEGGGHTIAAGAKLGEKDKKVFLEKLNEKIRALWNGRENKV